MENSWHNLHKPEEALKMDVPAVAQRQGQEHLQSILVSGVAGELHHANPMLQEVPSKREPWSLMKEMTYQKTPQSPEEQ